MNEQKNIVDIIVTYPNPVLSSRSDEVDYDAEYKSLESAIEMAKRAMYATNGCGIAAPQIGLSKRFIIVDCGYDEDDESTRNPIVLINPEVVGRSNEVVESEEGCLSFPGVNFIIKDRSARVSVEYVDSDGKIARIDADGLLSRCLQHEIEHLDGVTLMDHMNGLKRVQASVMLNAASKMGVAPGERSSHLVR